MGVCMAEWRDIEGHEGYQVSDDGRVRNHRYGHCRELKTRTNRFTGYQFIIIQGATLTIHRLVASAFIPNPDNLPQINHKNEVKTDNRVDNLEWCTQAYNNDYSKYRRYKPVELWTMDNEKLATFENERAAAQILGVGKSAVSLALNGAHKSCAGFILKYAGKDGEQDGSASSGIGLQRLG